MFKKGDQVGLELTLITVMALIHAMKNQPEDSHAGQPQFTLPDEGREEECETPTCERPRSGIEATIPEN